MKPKVKGAWKLAKHNESHSKGRREELRDTLPQRQGVFPRSGIF